jgi:hypothetical protein
MNAQIVVNRKKSRQGQENILGFPQGKFEHLGDFIWRCDMKGESDVDKWMQKLGEWNLKHYWALRDGDELNEMEARAMCTAIERKIDELSKMHYGVSI